MIAIIAILAAILFPVFAQARAKARQTTCLSNEKQTALGFLQYSQDYDELMPNAKLLYGGTWGTENYIWTVPSTSAVSGTVWANAIQPYLKNYAVFYCPQTKPTNGTSAVNTSFTMNGLLNDFPQSGIVQPSSAIMLWSGMAKNSYNGAAWSNPHLDCGDITKPCVYHPVLTAADGSTSCYTAGNGGTSEPTVFGGWTSYSAWVHGQGDNVTFCDGHTKWYPMPGGGANYDPWAYSDGAGNMLIGGYYSWYYDGCHVYYLQPDYQPGIS